MDNNELSKRQRYEILGSQLDNEQSSFRSHWRDLGDFIFPRRPRFSVTDTNRGDIRNYKIIDSTPTLAARILIAGMSGGITSPAREWFRLTTPDPELAEVGAVKEWLYLVERRMNTVFSKSNVYNIFPILYGDMGTFATGAMFVEEDFQQVIRCLSLPIGSYKIANDARGRVNVFMRDFRMTVRNLIEKFGRDQKGGEIQWDRFSVKVKSLWEIGQTETWIDVRHVIEPNEDYSEAGVHAKYKKYSSCYYERGTLQGDQNYLSGNDYEKFLSESGYDYFPVLCARWSVTGEDTYGTNCPGMEALGDIKQLMLGERRTMQAVEKGINPPMIAPLSLKNSKTSI